MDPSLETFWAETLPFISSNNPDPRQIEDFFRYLHTTFLKNRIQLSPNPFASPITFTCHDGSSFVIDIYSQIGHEDVIEPKSERKRKRSEEPQIISSSKLSPISVISRHHPTRDQMYSDSIYRPPAPDHWQTATSNQPYFHQVRQLPPFTSSQPPPAHQRDYRPYSGHPHPPPILSLYEYNQNLYNNSHPPRPPQAPLPPQPPPPPPPLPNHPYTYPMYSHIPWSSYDKFNTWTTNTPCVYGHGRASESDIYGSGSTAAYIPINRTQNDDQTNEPSTTPMSSTRELDRNVLVSSQRNSNMPEGEGFLSRIVDSLSIEQLCDRLREAELRHGTSIPPTLNVTPGTEIERDVGYWTAECARICEQKPDNGHSISNVMYYITYITYDMLIRALRLNGVEDSIKAARTELTRYLQGKSIKTMRHRVYRGELVYKFTHLLGCGVLVLDQAGGTKLEEWFGGEKWKDFNHWSSENPDGKAWVKRLKEKLDIKL